MHIGTTLTGLGCLFLFLKQRKGRMWGRKGDMLSDMEGALKGADEGWTWLYFIVCIYEILREEKIHYSVIISVLPSTGSLLIPLLHRPEVVRHLAESIIMVQATYLLVMAISSQVPLQNRSSWKVELEIRLVCCCNPCLYLRARRLATYTYLWSGWRNELPACHSRFEK